MSRASKFAQWGLLAGLIVAGVLIWNNRTALGDDFRLIGYTPPANVAALAADIRFTDQGKRYFYVSHPAIEGRAAFNSACGNTEAHTTVLGCYVRQSIFVYDVTDSRLDGVQEVTAAHETLHAAYARLSESERSRVDAMLTREYESLRGNAAFADRFAVYDSLSQADKLNELHSIFGTELPTLSAELETYYARYFADRSVVAGYYTAYQGQFDALKARQTALDQTIDSLKAEIESAQDAYDKDREALNRDIAAFNAKSADGGYASQSAFNADRNALVARANDLSAAASAINSNIDRYNNAINQYNALGIQTRDLQNSLDSKSVESVPSV